jgi:hypothetical protein
MPRVAIAVLESHAQAMLDELTRNDPGQLFGSQTTACNRCGTPFAIFFLNDLNPDNPSFAARLEETIAEHCENGKHAFDGLPWSTP